MAMDAGLRYPCPEGNGAPGRQQAGSMMNILTLSSPPPPVLPPIGELKMTHIADLRPFLKNINCKFMVLKKVEDGKPAKEGGLVYTFRVADESGSVIATLWNNVGAAVAVGDIILMAGGFVTMFRNTIRIACKLGTIIKMGSFAMCFNDMPDVSAPVWLPDPHNPHEMVKHEDVSDHVASQRRTMKP